MVQKYVLMEDIVLNNSANEVKVFLNKNYPQLKCYEIDVNKIVFEERVKIKCFQCSKFGVKWTCPPNIPNLNYSKILSEYNMIMLVYGEFKYTDQNYEDVRTESTNIIHRALLDLERYMFSRNHSLCTSFIGGSCKLCKSGCGKDKCNNQESARIPVEAIGINVVRTMNNVGIKVDFPVNKEIKRIGLLLL